jgi:hypothetical protein
MHLLWACWIKLCLVKKNYVSITIEVLSLIPFFLSSSFDIELRDLIILVFICGIFPNSWKACYITLSTSLVNELSSPIQLKTVPDFSNLCYDLVPYEMSCTYHVWFTN